MVFEKNIFIRLPQVSVKQRFPLKSGCWKRCNIHFGGGVLKHVLLDKRFKPFFKEFWGRLYTRNLRKLMHRAVSIFLRLKFIRNSPIPRKCFGGLSPQLLNCVTTFEKITNVWISKRIWFVYLQNVVTSFYTCLVIYCGKGCV